MADRRPTIPDAGGPDGGRRPRPATPRRATPPPAPPTRNQMEQRATTVPAAPNRPGFDLNDGLRFADYDSWRSGYAEMIDPWVAANPGKGDQVVSILWRQYTTNASVDWVYDQFTRSGVVEPDWAAISGGGGSGRRGGGGGGGGGGSAADQKAQAAAAIRNQAHTLGWMIGDDEINALANEAVTGRWSADQLTDRIVNGAAANWGGLAAGTLTGSVDAITKMAKDQLLNISLDSARQYAARLASGELDELGLRNIFQTQATMAYGWAGDQIASGVSVRDLLMPSRDLLANTLELPPESVDLMDPKWLGMLQTRDDKTGQVRAATQSEIVSRARKDERFAATKTARDGATQMATMLRDVLAL